MCNASSEVLSYLEASVVDEFVEFQAILIMIAFDIAILKATLNVN